MAPEVQAALLAGLIGVIGGYVFGFLQSRNERRDERRDGALAEIFRTMMLFYRGVIAWSSDPAGNPLTEPTTSWREYCRRRYEEFLEAYFGNSIWLGRETDELINEFAQAGRELLNEFNRMDAAGYLPDGTRAWDRRAQRLGPLQNEVKQALRAEMEASRHIIPYRIVVRRNAPEEPPGG